MKQNVNNDIPKDWPIACRRPFSPGEGNETVKF